MYIAFLRFSNNRSRARELMPAHNAWIRRGIDAGIFLVVGSLQPALGGAIIATGIPRNELDSMLQEDPFVTNDVVVVEVLEVSPTATDERFAFLMT